VVIPNLAEESSFQRKKLRRPDALSMIQSVVWEFFSWPVGCGVSQSNRRDCEKEVGGAGPAAKRRGWAAAAQQSKAAKQQYWLAGCTAWL